MKGRKGLMRAVVLAAVLVAAPAGAWTAAGASEPSRAEGLVERARRLRKQVASRGLTADASAEMRELSQECRKAAGGFFPAAGALAQARDAAGALDALESVQKVLEEAVKRAAAGAGLPGGQQRDGRARALMEGILSSQGYDLAPREPPWYTALLRKITGAVYRLLHRLAGSSRVVELVSRSYLLVILAVILSVLAIVTVRLVRERLRAAGAGESEPPARLFDSPEEHSKRALHCMEAGDYRQAFRQTFLMLLASLEALKLAAFDRSRTNHEYAAEFLRRSQDSRAGTVMASIVARYDYKWYGGAACTARDVRELESDSNALLERVRPSAEAR